MIQQRTISHPIYMIVCLFLTAAVPVSAQRHPDALKIPPLQINAPEPARHVLSNGMVVYMLEDHELPLFHASAMFRVGSFYEPADKVGLASLTGTVMRTGGTVAETGDALDATLEFIAGSVETSIGSESGSVSLSVLQKDIDQGLAIFNDVMREPAFRQDKIDLAKRQVLEGIRRQNDNPGGIANREFRFKLFGADSPHARRATVESIERITREDMVAFHRRFFHPNNAILSVSGDFDSADLLRQLEQLFQEWPKQDVTIPDVAEVTTTVKAAVYQVEQDITQTNIILGHFGVARHHPDFFAIRVMNQILSFQRLFFRVRTEAGLAYSVGSRFSLGTDVGTYMASMQTRAGATVRAITLMKETIAEMRQHLVTDDELQTAKDGYLNSFVFNFTSPQQIVSQQASYEFHGYPTDYLETYRDNIDNVTQKDVLRVAQQFLHPDQAVLMVVGQSALFDESLEAFGTVTRITLEEISKE